MFCEKCGNDNPENSKFCASCGAIIEPTETTAQVDEPATEPAASTAPPPKVEQAPPPAPKPAPVQHTDTKSTYNKKGNLIKPLSVGAYMGMFILMAIPVINLVMLLVWSFSDSGNINKKHFAIGYLIVILIGIVLTVAAIIVYFRLGWGFADFLYNWW